MTVNELIEKLKNVPEDAEVTLNYVYPVDTGETVSSTEDVAAAVYDRFSKTLDLVTLGYKLENPDLEEN